MIPCISRSARAWRTRAVLAALLLGSGGGCAVDMASHPQVAAEAATGSTVDQIEGGRISASDFVKVPEMKGEALEARRMSRGSNVPSEELTPDDEPADAETEEQMWRGIEQVFGRKGEVRDGVYRLVTPRSDLFVTMEGMDVPTGAFLESDFRFWRCPCGKLLVNGQFALADYEANDVVDELQKGNLQLVSIAPLLLHEHPRLLLVRFQGEGRTEPIAQALRSALAYTGDARNAPQPYDLSPED